MRSTPIHAFRHDHGCMPLGHTAALQQCCVHHDSIPIFNQHVAAIRQFRFMTATLARQSRVRIRC
jgi:hypothetical protein